jgi:hypothetical protein
MEENTIPISRPQNQYSAVPEVVKQVLEKEKKLPNSPSVFDENDIPQQFIEKPKYPTTQVNLVSEGILYPEGHPLSTGVVELKQVTAYHEDILSNESYIKKGTVLTKLLESLLVDKRIKVVDFLTCDLNGIYITIRRMTYGDEYNVKVKCPSCGVEEELLINLGSFQPKPINYDLFKKGLNQFEFTTPVGKNNIVFKIISQKEDEAIDSEIKSLARINKEKSANLSVRLKHIILSIDGNDDKTYIRKFIENELLAKDSLAFRKYIKEISPDIPMETVFNCSSCDFIEERLSVPLSLGFFWPDSR